MRKSVAVVVIRAVSLAAATVLVWQLLAPPRGISALGASGEARSRPAEKRPEGKPGNGDTAAHGGKQPSTMPAEKEARGTAAPGGKEDRGIPTVAILPFACRAGPEYKDLATAIILVTGGAIQQSGRAAIVDRDRVDRFIGEKGMAKADLTDKEELARKGQVIGADYVITGSFDRIEEELQVTAVLIPSARSDYAEQYDDKFKRGYKQVRVRGPWDDSIALIEQFASQVCELLPAPAAATTQATGSLKVGPDKALAVFDFSATPTNEDTKALANVLTHLMYTSLQEALPLRFVDRERLQALLREKKLQMAGLTRRSQALCAAKLVGADYILIGAVLHYARSARLDVQMVDVASGAAIASASQSGKYDDLLKMHKGLAVGLAERMGAGLEQVRLLRERKAGASVEAYIQSRRAVQMWWRRKEIPNCRQRVKELIDLALELDSENANVLHDAGIIYKSLGMLDKAERYYRLAVEKDPQSWWHAFGLGWFLWAQRDDPERALECAKRALQLRRETKPRPDKRPDRLAASCLRDLGRYEDAEPYAKRAATIKGGNSRTRALYAEVLGELGKYKEAARWYEHAAVHDQTKGRLLRKALEMYEKLGDDNEAMRILDQLASRRRATSQERLRLAEHLQKRDPSAAAAHCYSVLERDEDTPKARAAKLLKEMGFPPRPPLPSGPVFDVEKMRGMGIRILLQPYETFLFPKRLPYLKACLEDALGIPVEISREVRPFVAAEYQREADRISAHDLTANDLKRAGRENKAVAVVAVTSVKIAGVYSKRFTLGNPGTAIVSTQDHDMANRSNVREYRQRGLMWRREAEVMARLQRFTLKSAAYSAMPPGWSIRGRQCRMAKCALRSYSGVYYRAELLPCHDCRKFLQSKRPKWPKGPLHRPPIQAGPARTILPLGKKLLFVPVGISAKEENLTAIAKALRLTVGMEVRIADEIPIPEADKRDKFGYRFDTGILQRVKGLKIDGEIPDAICALTSDRTWDEYAGTKWRMWIPGAPGVPEDVRRPIICVSTQELRESLDRTETVMLPADGETRKLQVPQYGKLFVGALASAALEHHDCWTYGCPTTLWLGIGAPQRCSYWLCPQCRKAVLDYYAKPRPASAGER